MSFLTAAMERGLQLVLQIAVGRESEALGRLTLGIEGDQLARNILDSLFGGVLEFLPSTVAELVDLGRFAVAGLVTRNAVKRMDVDEKHVAILINQFDGLMLLAALVDLDQSVEPPDAMVDMDNVVAGPQAVQLGDGHLLVALDLAVDAVALVAVENLVVGIEAELQLVVDESLVQRNGQRTYDGLSASDLVEDVFEPLDLNAVLGENIGFVSPQGVADHVVGEQLEILVELGLGRRGETHLGGSGTLGQAVAQKEQPALHQVAQQPVAAGQQAVDLLGMLHVAERLAAHVVDLAQHEIGIEKPERRLAADEPGQRNPRLSGLGAVEIGNDGHMGQLLGRELAGDLETPDGVHFVAEEIDAERLAFRERKDIDDTAAQRILPRLEDEIDTLEPGIDQRLLQHLDGNLVADTHVDGILLQGLPIGDPLGERLRIGADNQIILPVETAQGIQSRRAQHDALGILRTVGNRPFPRGGEEEDAPLVEQGIKIVQQISRSIPLLGHEDMHTADPGDSRSGIERKRPADQLLEMDGGAPVAQPPTQRPERLRPCGELRYLLAGRDHE